MVSRRGFLNTLLAPAVVARAASSQTPERRIRTRSQGDQLGVRQSCQIYNSESEIDATLEIVRKLAG